VLRRILGGALLLGIGGAAQAQPVDIAPLISPPLPGVLPAPQPKIVAPPVAPAATSAAPLPPGPAVHIDAVRVEGVTVYSAASLAPLYAGLVGATVARARLDAVVENLQLRYRKDGYILTVVHGELRQPDGRTVFVLHAIEGYVSEVKLDGNIGPAGTLAYRYLEHLTWIRPVRNADLERYLLLVQDIPGVSVRAVLRHVSPEPGAVQLVAQLSRKPVTGYFQYDNLASPVAGPNEMLVSGASNSFTEFGEQIQGLFYNTFSREQIFGQVNASAFLGSEGLKLWGYAGKGNSLPGGALAVVGFNGDYTVGGLGLSYPWIRSRRLNLSLDSDLDIYNSTVDVNGFGGPAFELNESDLRILRAGETLDFQDAVFAGLPAGNLFILKLSQGLSGLGATANGAPFEARPGVQNDFTKFAGEFTRVQTLATFGRVATALKLSFGGQYTGDVLPPSEEFFFGGVRWGRGYYYGQVTGDRAAAATVELQANTGFPGVPGLAPDRRLDVQFFGFYDFGRAYNLVPGESNQTLQSIGVGARSDVTPWLFVELAGIRRLTTQPNGANTSELADYMLFSRVAIHN
jgi:hemolysin activation/secretion protein